MVAAAAVGGIVSAGSAAYGAKQARKASKAQIEAGNAASALEKESADAQLALQKQIWEKQQADQLPYLQQGQAAIGKLGSLMGGSDPFESYLQRAGLQGGLDAYLKQKGVSNYGFLNSPQYQFLQKQGQQALDRSAAARGMGYSGAQMKAVQQFGQDLASQQYDNEYNRAAKEYFNKYDQARGQFGDYYNRLAGIAQGGQQTAQSLGGMGSQYATNASNTLGGLSNEQSNILGQQANARASAYAAKANALNNTLGGLADLWSMRRKAV